MRRLWLLAVVATACASTPGESRRTGYASPAHRRMFETAVKVVVQCFDGETASGGGVAVNRWHVVTSRHLVQACTGEPSLIWVQGRGRRTIEMVVDAVADDLDAARLVAVGVVPPFETFARPSATPAQIGDTVCTVTSDAQAARFLLRCAPLAEAGDRLIAALDLAPGASGAPVFDRRGDVVGIWTSGPLDPESSRYTVAIATPRWRQLIVDDVAELDFGARTY